MCACGGLGGGGGGEEGGRHTGFLTIFDNLVGAFQKESLVG